MLTWGIVVVLCCVIMGQTLLFRRKCRRLAQALSHALAQIAQLEAAPPPQPEPTPPPEPVSQPEPAPQQKLYLPDLPEPEADPLVYFNENTGIYHADRACAPYQAVPVSLAEVIDHARPCKKCAEGRFPAPAPRESPVEQEADQLSLFEL